MQLFSLLVVDPFFFVKIQKPPSWLMSNPTNPQGRLRYPEKEKTAIVLLCNTNIPQKKIISSHSMKSSDRRKRKQHNSMDFTNPKRSQLHNTVCSY